MSYTMTQLGYDKITTELKKLKIEDRPRIIQAIADAREHGDLAENAEYHAARDEQGQTEARIQQLEGIMSEANVVDPTTFEGDKVIFGAQVKLLNEDTEEEIQYIIVSEIESDAENGLISNMSPIGRALIGKHLGDSLIVEAPIGDKYYEILEVNYDYSMGNA